MSERERTDRLSSSLPSVWRVLKRLVPYALRYRRHLVVAAVATLCTSGMQLSVPLINKHIIDDAILGENPELLLRLVALWASLVVLQTGLGVLRTHQLTLLHQRILFQLRLLLFRHTQGLPLEYFRTSSSGYLTSRIASEIHELAPLLGDQMVSMFQNILMIALGTPLAIMIQPTLALLILLIAPLYLVSYRALGGRLRTMSRADHENWSRVRSRIQESLAQILAVKMFNREPYEARRLVRASKTALRHRVRLVMLQAAGSAVLQLLAGLGPILILVYAGVLIVAGEMTLGELIAFGVYMGLLVRPIQSIFQFGFTVQSGVAAAERFFALLDEPTEEQLRSPGPRVQLACLTGRVEIRNLVFGHHRDQTPLLDGLSLEVRPGEVVVLRGANGSGKSTLIQLLLGFHEPWKGEILFDGHDIRDLDRPTLRRLIGVVTQENQLFNGSIAENIAYGSAQARLRDVEEAARRAQVFEFAEQLPQGLDTAVGEAGGKLSQGQLQRVALARALIKSPNLLIFDEGLSSIDQRSRGLIWGVIENLASQGVAVILVSHERETPPIADRVVEIPTGATHTLPRPRNRLSASA